MLCACSTLVDEPDNNQASSRLRRLHTLLVSWLGHKDHIARMSLSIVISGVFILLTWSGTIIAVITSDIHSIHGPCCCRPRRRCSGYRGNICSGQIRVRPRLKSLRWSSSVSSGLRPFFPDSAVPATLPSCMVGWLARVGRMVTARAVPH